MRLLLVTGRYPWPPRRGDQLRAAQLLSLLPEDWEVTLLTPAPAGGMPPPPVSRVSVVPYRLDRWPRRGLSLLRALATGEAMQAALFRHRELGERLRLLAPRHDLAILQLARLAMHLEDAAGAPELIVDLIDSLSLNLERRAAYDRGWLRPLLRWEAARLRRTETRVIGRARQAWVVCERDRRHLAAAAPELAERIAVLPVAIPPVPAAGSAGAASEAPGPPAPAYDLALTGNLGYFPTVDGACWFLDRVWPALCERRPGLRLLLAGARPSGRLLRAARRARRPGEGMVEVVASPPDLAALLARSRVAIAPMRAGSGQPLKILEAWRAGVPVIATPYAAAGVEGEPGEQLVAADGADEWLAAIEALIDDGAERRRLAEAGRRRLAERYRPEAVAAQLGSLLDRVTAPPPASA